jgi:RNA polymerase sigma factor (TIGR02999 family)
MAEGEITRHLLAAREGDRESFDRLFELVYPQLRALAHRELGSRPPTPTLGTTALVHEAYLKFVDQTQVDWRDRGHFFAAASRALRHIVVDHVRRQRAAKRGGEMPAPLLNDPPAAGPAIEDVIAIDEALRRLENVSPRLVQVVEMCFFAGLGASEAAEALQVSERTVKRDWRKAKLLLFTVLRSNP